MNETIVVQENVEGKFGPQLKDVAGSYYSFGQFYKGDKSFNPGTKLDVDLFISPKGNRYINKILAVGESTTEKKAGRPKKTVEAVQTVVAEAIKSSRTDWAAKDRSQLIGGLCHDAAQLTLATVTVGLKTEEVLKQFKEVLDGLIELRKGVK